MTLTTLLLRAASAAMPEERATWAEAMHAECAHIEAPDAALFFALGCLWTGCRTRLLSKSLQAGLVRSAGSFILAAGALWQFREIWRLHSFGILPLSYLTGGSVWLGAALALALWRQRIVRIAGAGILANLGLQSVYAIHLLHAQLPMVQEFGLACQASLYFAASLALPDRIRSLPFLGAVAAAINLINWLLVLAAGGPPPARWLDGETSLVLLLGAVLGFALWRAPNKRENGAC